MQALLCSDGVYLVGRYPIGEHRIQIERSANGLGGIEPITGDHDDAAYTG
jgi:hypothetical protein